MGQRPRSDDGGPSAPLAVRVTSGGSAFDAPTDPGEDHEDVTAPIPPGMRARVELMERATRARGPQNEIVASLLAELQRSVDEGRRAAEEIAGLRHALDRAMTEGAAARRDLTSVRRDHLRAEGRARALEVELGGYRTEVRLESARLVETRLAFDQERQRLIQQELELKGLRAEVSRLVGVGRKAETREAGLEAALRELRVREAVLSQEIDAVRLDLDSMQVRHQEALAEGERQRALAQRSTAGVRAARAVAEEAEEAVRRVAEDLAAISAREVAARAEVEVQRRERAEVEQARADLEAQLGAVREELEAASAELVHAQGALSAAEARIAELEGERAQAASDLSELQAAHEAQRLASVEQEARVGELRAAVAEHQARLDQARARAEALEGEMAEREREGQTRAAGLEAERGQERERADALRAELAAVEERGAEIEVARESLAQQLTAAHARLTELEGEIEALKATFDEITQEQPEPFPDAHLLEHVRAEADMARSLVDAQAREAERTRVRADQLLRQLETQHKAREKERATLVEQRRLLEISRRALKRYRKRARHDASRWPPQEAELGAAVTSLYAVAHAFPRQLDEMETVLKRLLGVLDSTRRMVEAHNAEAEQSWELLTTVPAEVPPPGKEEGGGEG